MKTKDIIIFGGQSNMQGQTERLSETAPVAGAVEYRFSSDTFVPLQNPVGDDLTYDHQLGYAFSNGCNAAEWREKDVLGSACYGHTNLVPAFCRAYLAQTHSEVIAVHAAKGSTQIHDWLPSTAGYNALVKKAAAAIQKAKNEYTVGKIYFVWLQGESDAIFSVKREEYKKRRDTLCSKLAEIPGIVFEIPGGAFYVMAALPVDDTDKFQQWLLEEFDDNGETVMFAPAAPMYATPGKGGNEIRMAYVIESEKLARAMDILKKGIEVYNKK